MPSMPVQYCHPIPDGQSSHPRSKNSWRAKNGTIRGAPPLRVLPSLPNEIFCSIFSQCKGLDAGAPTTISHVCRRWRQIALSQCELWADIQLRRRETRLDRASAWADRAGVLPISLGIRYSEDIDIERVLAWLTDKAHRIGSVTIFHMSRIDQNPLLSSLPALENMKSFQVVGLEEIDLDMRLIAQILEGSPHLSSLSWSGIGGFHSHESLAGGAGQITHLSIGADSYIDYVFPPWVDAILNVLSSCTNLVSLECHALGVEDDSDPQMVSLPSLSSLTIGDGPETCVILKYIHAPRLRTLRLARGSNLNESGDVMDLSNMEFDRNAYIDLFLGCIRCLHKTCSPPVTRVILDGAAIGINMLHQCAPYLHRMEELRCHKIGGIPLDLLELGTEVAHHPFPCLRSMVLTGCTIDTRWLSTIQAMIRQKGAVNTLPIEQLIVEDCPGVSDLFFRRTCWR